MSSTQPEIEAIYNLGASFVDLLTEEGERYLTTLPVSGLLTVENVRRLRRILLHFESRVDEESSRPDANSQDQATTDDDDSFTDALESREDAPSTSQSSHAQVMAGIDKNPTGVQYSTTPRQTPLFPGGPDETASVVPKKRGRPSNASTNALSTKANIYSKSWGAILAVNHFELDDVFRRYLDAGPSQDAASFFKDDLPALDNPDQDHLADFLQFCRAVDKMPRDDSMDAVRRLFLWVTVGDLAYNIFGADWSNTKKQGIKSIMTKTLNEGDYETLRGKLLLAAQLTFICRNLGMGALFWLRSQLSDFFLKKKVTQGGNSFLEMMRHVHSRGLPESLQTSGANRSGNAIRAYLCSKYKIEEEKSVAVELSSDLLDSSGSGSGEEIRGQDNGEGDMQA